MTGELGVNPAFGELEGPKEDSLWLDQGSLQARGRVGAGRRPCCLLADFWN